MQKGKYDNKAKIKVVGIGGAGNNAVTRMFDENIQGSEFFIINTDSQVLKSSSLPEPNKLIIGEKITKGLGSGADPEIGRKSALESEDSIRKIFEDTDLVFLACGMGGGTGTGSAPVIAKIAKESGALVIAIATRPFLFEGKQRVHHAEKGLEELKKNVDSLIVISNDRLLEFIGSMPIIDSFKEADYILKQGVQTITNLVVVPAVINLDFADIKKVMSNKGSALFGIGVGSGKEKASMAAHDAINSSLLEASIEGSKDVLVNITVGRTASLNDAKEAVEIITQSINNPDLNIVFGIAIDDDLTENDEIIVTVIATGFPDENWNFKRQNFNNEIVAHSNNIVNEILKEKETKQEKRFLENFDDDDFPTFLN